MYNKKLFELYGVQAGGASWENNDLERGLATGVRHQGKLDRQNRHRFLSCQLSTMSPIRFLMTLFIPQFTMNCCLSASVLLHELVCHTSGTKLLCP